MHGDIKCTRKWPHRMTYAEAKRTDQCSDIRYTFFDMWLSFDYIIFAHIIEGRWDIDEQVKQHAWLSSGEDHH